MATIMPERKKEELATWPLVATIGALILGFLVVLGLLLTHQDYQHKTQVSTKELKCQHRRSWLIAAEAYDKAFLSCAKHYDGALYSSKLIAERCDEEVSRSHEPRWRIKEQLELSRKYANQCGVVE